MDGLIDKIEIDDFITIKILDLNSEDCVYFVDSYNENYFYMKDNNKLCTCPIFYTFYDLYFQKAEIIHHDNLDELKKDVYKLYKQLTFSIPRVEKGQYYYVIENDFTVDVVEENNDDIDNNYYKRFNYFTNKEEAKKYAEKLKQYLIKSRKEDYVNEHRK